MIEFRLDINQIKLCPAHFYRRIHENNFRSRCVRVNVSGFFCPLRTNLHMSDAPKNANYSSFENRPPNRKQVFPVQMAHQVDLFTPSVANVRRGYARIRIKRPQFHLETQCQVLQISYIRVGSHGQIQNFQSNSV